MQCPSCLKEIDEIDSYCRFCGKSLKNGFIKKYHALISLITISTIIALYLLGLLVNFNYCFNSLLIQMFCLLGAGLASAISIIGIVHSITCKKYLKVYYGLATSIVGCSLSGCFILYEIIRLVLWFI